MKERGIDPRRLRLVAICTVCTTPFKREVDQMNKLLAEIGPVQAEMTRLDGAVPVPAAESGGQAYAA